MLDAYQQFIFKSRYARYLPDKQRREHWPETVRRYIDFMSDHVLKKHGHSVSIELQNELFDAIHNLEIMPSMRAMMTAGKALERDNVAGYNCAFMPIDDPKAFDEAMFILMCGTGVGFSVERQYINQLPEIPDRLFESDTVIHVKDSKEGWAKALRQIIAILYSGEIAKWDVSKLRPAGAPLKTFGGRSSGPDPLVDLFRFIVRIFRNAVGRRLTSLECHDIMCKIGEVVVVGGVRRSAMISLSNLSDDRMRNCKSGAWWEANVQRALSNNSAVYTERPDIGLFMKEWLSLYESKSGERGMFNREASRSAARKSGRRDVEWEFGTNPCSEIILRPYQFCVAPNTPLITTDGIFNISSLVDKKVNIWNGKEWTEVTVRKTGSNQRLMRVHLSDGSHLDCTPDHRWSVKDRFQNTWHEVQTKDLMTFSKYSVQVEPANVDSPNGGMRIPDAYTLGFAVGDGCVYKDHVLIDLHGEKDWDCPVEGVRHKPQINYGGTSTYVRCNATKVVNPDLVKELKNDETSWIKHLGKWSRQTVAEFIAGLADADGSETDTGGIRIYVNGYEKGRAIQLVLAKHGIRCSVNLHQKEGTPTNLSVRKRDSWYVQITNCAGIPCHRLDVSQGHEPVNKGKYQNIRLVEEIDGLHDTYCFNEPKEHKGMFGNVLTYQCNLTEVVVRADDTVESLERKVRLATIMGTFQSTLTHFPYLRKIWNKNTEEERLLGVSITGIYDHKILNNWKDKSLPERLEKLRMAAIETNKQMADLLGIPQSTAITCVKPSGTVSQLVDAASGIHPRHDHYYFRRVRSDMKDPLTKYLVEAGISAEPDVTKPDSTMVFTFPKKAPSHALTRNEVTSIDHLNLWLLYQRHWCEHKPSVTINVKEEDWVKVGAWVYENFDELSGVSFLPYDGGTYRQAPYETVTKEEYDILLAKTPQKIEWDELKEFEDMVEGVQTLACSSGSCEI